MLQHPEGPRSSRCSVRDRRPGNHGEVTERPRKRHAVHTREAVVSATQHGCHQKRSPERPGSRRKPRCSLYTGDSHTSVTPAAPFTRLKSGPLSPLRATEPISSEAVAPTWKRWRPAGGLLPEAERRAGRGSGYRQSPEDCGTRCLLRLLLNRRRLFFLHWLLFYLCLLGYLL